MGSNSGGDYRVLSKALSAPLGTEGRIQHRLVLSAASQAGLEGTICCMVRLRGTSGHSWIQGETWILL